MTNPNQEKKSLLITLNELAEKYHDKETLYNHIQGLNGKLP